MFSSKTGEWDTPQKLIDDLSTVFKWDLDVCASRPNVCNNYYSEEDNSFKNQWADLCWMNPPYGDPILPCKAGCTRKLCKKRGYHDYENYQPGIIDWIYRARRLTFSEQLPSKITAVVCLVPARTDTKWWQDNTPYASQIVLIRGRLKFGKAKNSAPFPSAFVVFGAITGKQASKLASYGMGVRPHPLDVFAGSG